MIYIYIFQYYYTQTYIMYNFSKISDKAMISHEFLLIFNTLFTILKSSMTSTSSLISL